MVNKGIMKFPRDKEVMVKFLGEKEAMLIDDDSYPPITSINTTVFYFKAVMNSKKRGIPPSHRIKNVWIPMQYVTYKNDLAVEREVSTVKENKKEKKKASKPFIWAKFNGVRAGSKG